MVTISTKFVIRLLDAEHTLLGWQELYPPDVRSTGRASCGFFAKESTPIPIEQSGVAAYLTVHWCDLDVARIVPLPEPTPVDAGQVAQWAWIEPVWLVSGMRDVPMPPVTVRSSVALNPPSGTLTAITP